MILDKLQAAIEIQLEKIEKLLGPNYKLTLIASHNGAGELKDADFVLKMVDRATLLKTIDRFLPEKNKTKAPDLLEELMLVVADHVDIPESNCSCHLHPPCGDCVDYSHARSTIKECQQWLAARKEGA